MRQQENTLDDCILDPPIVNRLEPIVPQLSGAVRMRI